MKKARYLLPRHYNEIYKEMLQRLACEFSDRRKDKPCTAFWPMKGKFYKEREGLMVIGRAVNGWSVKERPKDNKGKGWYAKDLKNENEVEYLIEGIRCLSEDLSCEGWKNSAEKVNIRPKLKIEKSVSDCPMSWVVEKAGSRNGGYNTNRSAFWRVSKGVLEKLYSAEFSEERWSSHLCWSNLYKVAPLETGNPLKSSRDIQKSYSIELLKMELDAFDPKHILVVAGESWYKPFVDCLGIKMGKCNKDKLVENSGSRDGQTWVFAKHPQAKPQDRFVDEVSEAFKSA